MKASSKHLDNDKKATMASGEKKSGLMDGIVSGLPRRVSPAVVDGIVRGLSANMSGGVKPDVCSVVASATRSSKGNFGSGAFPEGHM